MFRESGYARKQKLRDKINNMSDPVPGYIIINIVTVGFLMAVSLGLGILIGLYIR